MWQSGLKCEFESHQDRTKSLSPHKSKSNIYTSKIKPRSVRIRFIYIHVYIYIRLKIKPNRVRIRF